MVKGPIEEVSDEEVKRTLKEMKSGKVPGPTGKYGKRTNRRGLR